MLPCYRGQVPLKIRQELMAYLSGPPKFLAVIGPSGTGKVSCVKQVASEQGLEVKEIILETVYSGSNVPQLRKLVSPEFLGGNYVTLVLNAELVQGVFDKLHEHKVVFVSNGPLNGYKGQRLYFGRGLNYHQVQIRRAFPSFAPHLALTDRDQHAYMDTCAVLERPSDAHAGQVHETWLLNNACRAMTLEGAAFFMDLACETSDPEALLLGVRQSFEVFGRGFKRIRLEGFVQLPSVKKRKVETIEDLEQLFTKPLEAKTVVLEELPEPASSVGT